ncbi:hypothetical protein F4604DRAFT_1927399 [Suillus subluteus]|nr:hypothetical protein F4604DRAFT_1927399 [Suillus subluteus]
MQSYAAEQKQPEDRDDRVEDSRNHIGFLRRTTQLLSRYGIETHGIVPVPVEERLETRWYQLFFVWFSSCMNLLSYGFSTVLIPAQFSNPPNTCRFSTGTTGPAFFSMGVRDCLAIIIVVNLVCCLLPGFSAVFGPKLGMRAMVQARFSWGYFGAIIPAVLNAFSLEGFLILKCIIGGQTIASLSSQLNDTLGIVILCIISLIVTFCGYRVIHWYESVAWIPNVIAFIAMLAVGYPQLRENLSAPVPPATPANVISFAPDASSARIFIYTYLGFFVSNVTGQALGAAFAAAAPSVPAWNAGFDDSSSVGGLLHSVLLPTGAFGKILTALVALSISSACAPTMYTFSNSFMAIAYVVFYGAQMGICPHLGRNWPLLVPKGFTLPLSTSLTSLDIGHQHSLR